MYSSLQLAFKYLEYYITASNGKGHGMHSPFVFDLITNVLNDKKNYGDYDKVEALRQRLLNDSSELEVEDFGAGSGIDKSNRRKISSIAQHAAKPKKFGQLLYRMVKYYKPNTILELGTSLGITTSYLSLANPAARIITMEGASSIAGKAARNFNELELVNTKIIEGNFDNTLQLTLNAIPSLDFVFLDGNHREEPTVRYFNSMLPKINNDTIIVADDIHWSRGMEHAWHSIKQHEAVTCSIDLFFVGIVFFRNSFHERQHFTIRF